MREIQLGDDEIAYLEGTRGTLAFIKTLGQFFYVETESEEIILFTENDDLLVASTFGSDEKFRRGLNCTLYLIRELGAPLIVLPKGHPASSKLKVVVSVGSLTRIKCDIQAGTHPEQDVLCGVSEFAGVEIRGAPGGGEVINFQGEIRIDKL